jgi:hypothetical protein
VGKPEEKTLLSLRHKWEDNIKMHLQEIGRDAWTGFI